MTQFSSKFIESLLSLSSTSQISSTISLSYPEIPASLLTSCIVFLKKNSINDVEKVLIFMNILLRVHLEAIKYGHGVVNVFENLKIELLKYTVNAPPFSVELFSLNDYKILSTWICEIYLKHYKMFLYRDGRKEIATVAAFPPSEFSIGNLCQVEIRPLGESISSELWVKPEPEEQLPNETAVEVEEEVPTEQYEQEEATEEEIQEKKTYGDIQESQNPPDIKNAYIKRQLEEIQKMLLQFSEDKLVNVEARLKNIEEAVQQQETEPATKGKKK